jgi:hypothetical protein
MKRGLAVTGVGMLLWAIASAWGCSSDESTGSTEPADPTKCGPGPYGQLTGTALELTADGTTRPKPDVVITADLCPGKTFTTGADGKAIVQLTKNKPVVFTADHPDDLPTRTAEYSLEKDVAEGTASMVPKIFRAVVAPEFGEDKTLFALGIVFPPGALDAGTSSDAGPTDPCLRREGITYTIPGHPEAKVVYFNAEPIPKPDPAATATATNGLARIDGVPDGVTIEPVATKAGCTIVAKHDGFTGRATAAKGFLVGMPFLMTK